MIRAFILMLALAAAAFAGYVAGTPTCAPGKAYVFTVQAPDGKWVQLRGCSDFKESLAFIPDTAAADTSRKKPPKK